MKFFDRIFPVFFVLPFLFATMSWEPLQVSGEVARWGMLLLALGLATFQGFERGGGRMGLGLKDLVAGGFLLLFLLSSVWSILPVTSAQRAIAVALLYLASFWCFWGWADRHSDQRLIDLVLATLAVVLGVNLVLGAAFAPSTIFTGRFQGLFINPNNIGLIVSLAIPLSFGRAMASRRRKDWLIWGVFLLNNLACGSRGALVGSLVAMALIVVLSASRRPLLALTILIAATLGVTFLYGTAVFQEKVLRADTLETMSNRTAFWDLAKEIYIPSRPLLGHGFGGDEFIHDFYGVNIMDLKLRGYGVMSSYYGLAVCVGGPAAVLFFSALWLGAVVPMIRYRRDARLVGLAAAVISGLLISIVEPAIYSAGNCFAFLFWISLMLVLRRASYRSAGIRLDGMGGLMPMPRKRRPRRSPARVGGIGSAPAVIATVIEGHESPALHGHL